MTEQGVTYTTFVAAELDNERARRANYDARGQTLVTTSSSLVTLLAAVAAFVRTGDTVVFPRGALIPLCVALGALAVASGLGILASWNRLYHIVAPDTLRKMCREHWTDDEVDARNFIAIARIQTVETLRSGNNRKATLVGLGLIAQLVALIALSAAVFLVLWAN